MGVEVVETPKESKPRAKTYEVSALIKAGDKDKARDYFSQHDWTGLGNLEKKLTSHFKS